MYGTWSTSTWAQIMKCVCVIGVKMKEEMLIERQFFHIFFNSVKVEVLLLTCLASNMFIVNFSINRVFAFWM